jgi:hypothetical protein
VTCGPSLGAVPGPRTAQLAAAVLLSALAWVGWLAWDQEYQLDPVTGVASGPYETWQVAGCVLTLLVAAVLAGLARRPVSAAVWVTVPFTLCWTISAAQDDETGLFAAGALFLAVGLFLGSWVVAAATRRVAG